MKAGSLFCYLAVRESGISQVDLSNFLKLSPMPRTFAVKRDELIAHEKNITLP